MSSKGKTSTAMGGGPAFVPKRRFAEFRDAGEWQEKSLSSFLTPAVRERTKPIESYKGLGLRSHGKGTFLKEKEDPAKNAMDVLYEVKREDLIVNITFAWEGAIAIAGSSDEGALVSHRFPTYTFSKDRALPGFFKFKVVDKQFVYKLGLISPGGAGRNRVMSKADFLKLKVLLPSPGEQKKIADCLDSADALIAAQVSIGVQT
jgi:type I restriction enzyme S subunit